jgi:hypothetical protein
MRSTPPGVFRSSILADFSRVGAHVRRHALKPIRRADEMTFGQGTIAQLLRYHVMNLEKQALKAHAERCRQTADELFGEPAERLRAMADEYEVRAERLDEQEAQLCRCLTTRRRHGSRVGNPTAAKD